MAACHGLEQQGHLPSVVAWVVSWEAMVGCVGTYGSVADLGSSLWIFGAKPTAFVTMTFTSSLSSNSSLS